MKKIFLSLPMKDVPYEELLHNIDCMEADILQEIEADPKRFGIKHLAEIEFVDNLSCKQPPKDIKHPRTWYVSEAIKIIADCDFAYFHEQWNKAPGCIIEHTACVQHNIPIFYISPTKSHYEKAMEQDKDTNVVEALGAKWTWGGKERPKYVKMDPQGRYKKALKNAFEEAEWFFTGVMNEMNERDIQDCHDMVNAIVDAAVLKYEWKKHILEGENGET